MTLSIQDLETVPALRRTACTGCGGLKPAGRGRLRCEPCARTHVTRTITSRLSVEGDCLVYTGTRDENGYGRIYANGKGAQKVHRLVWESAHGPIPSGMVICHRCDNPPCALLSHLFIGTVADNNRDRDSKGRSAPNLDLGREAVKARAASITHCPKGHPYSGENVRYRKSGARRCAECYRTAARTRSTKKANV